MIKRTFYLASCFIALSAASLESFNPDNRYFPFIPRAYITVPCRPSYFAAELFFTTANKAFGYAQEDIGIPELYGNFDLGYMGDSLTAVGLANPLPAEFVGQQIPYSIRGTIRSEGVGLFYRQAIHRWFSFGWHIFFMHVNSLQEFFLDNKRIPKAERLELDMARLTMFKELGLSCGYSSQAGIGDIDLYARMGDAWDYVLKFRRIQAGLSLGALFPTGNRMNINNPASVPFGGNGHYGLYVSVDAEFEAKEDFKVGLIGYISKRLKRTQLARMPVYIEVEPDVPVTGPQIFGAVVGAASVDPGVTFIFSPYFSAENIRAGLGGRIQYTLTQHMRDCWKDLRQDATVPVTLNQVEDLSAWASDYISLSVFYDFGKLKTRRTLSPIVQLQWDIPALFVVGQGVVKTNKIALSVEFNF